MTCKERYLKEHPEHNSDSDWTIVLDNYCPSDYGYLDDPECCIIYTSRGHGIVLDETCVKCWNREIPNTCGLCIEKHKARLQR